NAIHTEEVTKTKVEEVLSELGINSVNIIQKISLIGKDEVRKKIKVTLTSEAREELLRKCRELRNSTRFPSVYVNKDLTPAEEELEYTRRTELKRQLLVKQEEQPYKRFVIR